MLDNTENTFVTSVFNGSTSLRNAAGQMIENVTKSVKRKEVIDEQYMEDLYKDMTSLYRLDQGGMSGITSGGKAELGELPGTAVALLAALGGTWALIILYVVRDFLKKKR